MNLYLSYVICDINLAYDVTVIEIINNTRGGIVIFFSENKRERVFGGGQT